MPFTDNFNGASSNTALESWTPSGGGAWTRVDGSASAILVSASLGRAACQTATNTLYQCSSQGTSAHYAELRIFGTAFNSFLTNRATNSNNFIGARAQSAKIEIFKRVGGSFTLLGTSASSVTGTEVLRLESASDNKHTAKINGAQYLQVTDAFNSSEVRQGICCRQEFNEFDDFEAGPLSAPTPTINSITASDITSSSARITLGVTR